MKFIRLFSFDLKNGLLRNPFLLLSALLCGLLLSIDLWHTTYVLQDSCTLSPTFANYFMYAYGGMKEYIPDPQNPFAFPVVWMLVFLFPAFAVLNYPTKDIQAFGTQIIYRTRGRSAWWLSKCLWNVSTTLAFHLILLGVMLVFCLVCRIPISGEIDRELLFQVFRFDSFEIFALKETSLQLSAHLVLIPILISVGMNLLEMTLTLFVKPVYSFLIIAAVALASAYFLSPFLVDNFAMALRSDTILEEGIFQQNGYFAFAAMAVAAVLLGLLRMRSYDILNKE